MNGILDKKEGFKRCLFNFPSHSKKQNVTKCNQFSVHGVIGRKYMFLPGGIHIFVLNNKRLKTS